MGNAVATQSNAVNLPDSVVTTVRGNLMPGADSSYDIGASGTRFTNIYGDTLYGDGSNLTNLPTQVSIANNADNRVITGGSGTNLNGESPKSRIQKNIEESLRKLQTDVIDLYQIHFVPNDIPHEEYLEPLNELIVEGKVRHLGAVSYTHLTLPTKA